MTQTQNITPVPTHTNTSTQTKRIHAGSKVEEGISSLFCARSSLSPSAGSRVEPDERHRDSQTHNDQASPNQEVVGLSC